MNSSRDPERLIKEFLEQGIDELPDRSYELVRSAIEDTQQRVVIGPWRKEQMTRFVTFGMAAAAVVLVAVIGIRLLPVDGGPGSGPTPTPTTAPSPSSAPTASPTSLPTPQGSPIADPSGRLQAGAYVAHPFDTLFGMDARGFTFTTPSANWEAYGESGRMAGLAWNDGSGQSSGVGVGFLKVDSLNSDGCAWTTDTDIEIGPSVDDLVTALTVPNTTGFSAGEPYTENIANRTGRGIELTMPATLQIDDLECDESDYRIWNAAGFDIYAQGPSNTWRLGIFEVGGERYIVLASSMPDTPDEVRNELMSIFRSVLIDSSPGCPTFDHNCN